MSQRTARTSSHDQGAHHASDAAYGSSQAWRRSRPRRTGARAVWLGILLMALGALSAAAIAYWIETNRVPQYRSMARLLITPNPLLYDGRDLLASLETLERTSIQATYEEVLNSSRIRAAARAAVPFSDASSDDFDVEALALPSSDLIEVTAEGPSPVLAAQLANAVAQQGLTFLADRYPMYVIEALDDAVPAAEPFAPNVPRSLALALVVGAGIGLAIALWVTRASISTVYGIQAAPRRRFRPNERSSGQDDWLDASWAEDANR